jgi:GntR family transcriptional repressor for pyruvate dehydrogenase complex
VSGAPALAPLDRRPLSEQVAARLVGVIQDGPLAPGQFLPSQRDLCRSFGVSRPVLREALTSLVARGFIEVQNGKGARIVSRAPDPLVAIFRGAGSVDRGAVVELMELRRGIESQAAALAAERRTDEQVARLRSLLAEMRPSLHEPDRYNELDLQLHLAIAAATQNSMISHLMASLQETLRDTIRAGFRHRQEGAYLRRTQQLHEDVVDAIAEHQAVRARRTMERHFDDVIRAIRTSAQ